MATINLKHLEQSHEHVMSRVKVQKPTPRWQLIIVNILNKAIIAGCLLLSLGLSTWFVHNLMTNKPLLTPALIDISGVLWVWSPELFLFGIVFYTISMTRIDFSLFRYTKLLGFGAVAGLAILINIVLATPTTQAFGNNVNIKYNSLEYRILSRDNHVKALLEHDTYYGLVTKQDANLIEINHGGVVKSFIMPANTPILAGKLVEVDFKTENGKYVNTSYKEL
jgi:hypothetical protein